MMSMMMGSSITDKITLNDEGNYACSEHGSVFKDNEAAALHIQVRHGYGIRSARSIVKTLKSKE